MPESSFGSSFEPGMASREGEPVVRPTSERIADMANAFVEKERRALSEYGLVRDLIPIGDFVHWSKGEDPDDLSMKGYREKNYPGWTDEDFAELLALIEEGRRPDEERMRNSLNAFFEDKEREGWKKEDILRAMEMYKNPES